MRKWTAAEKKALVKRLAAGKAKKAAAKGGKKKSHWGGKKGDESKSRRDYMGKRKK